MVQESSTFGLCCSEFIKDIDCGSSKNIDSYCVTQCSPSINAISVEEEKEEELRRRKREELIQYYIDRHEAFLKNPYVCVDAIDHDYYLVPRGKRSKRKFIHRVDQSFLKRENKKLKMVHQEKKIQELGTQDEEVGISKIESFLKNVQGDVENIKKSLITTKEKVSILPMEKIQELEVVPNSEVSLGIPKIESFLKNEKRVKMLHKEKPNRVSEFALPMEYLKEKNQELVIEKERIPKIESFLKKEKRKRLVVLDKQKPNKVPPEAILPMELKDKIQDMEVPISKVSLVIQKTLFDTDLSKKHMRLSIPVGQVLTHDEFLTTQDKEYLETKDSRNKKAQIKFNLIEPSLEESSIHLAKWPMNSSPSYVLLNDWVSVYKRNNLKVNMKVQLWSFKKDSNRWLALVVLPPDDAAN
ncbi:hypothetical protein RND71_032247 [Anisodus tanguticus]|uniref:B3 domain-containing protein n=1 Tax=Anisodus tanguticus TaxID=243964 RepID=A0AAE1RE80_9SOLA|nr:hypothetical protein RND71_032246 [Anisodus tanguticus]KAK4349492.1 hypothetical protein RND71_032247 [Anisodus tanguticus]